MTLLLFFALLPSAACHPIQSDWIYGRDLAAAVPEFAKLPPDIRLGASPVPGQARVFHGTELRRIAQANQLTVPVMSDVCFTWQVSVVSPESIVAAMKKSLDGRSARIEIVDRSLVPAPSGRIIFPLSALSGASEGPVLWRGYVEYAENRRFLIWARVRLLVEEQHIVAVSDLAPDQPIQAGQVQLKTYSGPLTKRAFLSDLANVIGAVPRRSISAGAVLTEDMIEKPLDVERGALVDVFVQTGAAHVEAQGIAEQSGRCGDVISVKNPKSAREFRARITKPGTVVVVPGGLIELASEGTTL